MVPARVSAERVWRVGIVLAAAAIVLGFVGVIGVALVAGQTDSGLMCQSPWTPDDEPVACAVYDVPFAMVVAAAAAFAAGVVAILASFGLRSG
jgi:hypothetical protein